MFCPNCGKPVPDEAKFCPSCAHRLRRPEAMTPAEPVGDAPAAAKTTATPAASTTAQAATDALAATKRAAQAIATDVAQAAADEAAKPRDKKRTIRMVLLGADIVLFAFAPWFSLSGFYTFNLFGLGDALSQASGTMSSLGGASDLTSGLGAGGAIATLAGLITIGLLAFDLYREIRHRPGTPLAGIVGTVATLCAAMAAIAVNSKANSMLSYFSVSYDVISFQIGWFLAFVVSIVLVFFRSRAKDEATE